MISFAKTLIAHGLRRILILSLITSSATSCAAAEQALDKRVSESAYFTQLVAPDHWDPTTPLPKDSEQQHQGWCATGFDADKSRAVNLANNRHFAEAIREWSKVIERLQSANLVYDRDEAFALIERARLYEHLGLKSEALADIQEGSRLTNLNDEHRLRLALLSINLEENRLAEALLSKAGDLSNSHDKPLFKYVLAVVQGKNGKVSTALSSFLEAAKLFAVDGSTDCAQACLDAAFNLDKKSRHTKISIRDLTPPMSNHKATLHLLEALATRKDIFEKGVLEGLLSSDDAKSIGRKNTFSERQTARDSSEIPKPVIEKLANNGMRISMWLKPEVCVVSSNELTHVLGSPLPEYHERHIEYRGSKVYEVPAGLLVLVSREGGFNAIWLAQVYSAGTAYPQPRLPIPFITAESLKDPFFKASLARADENSLKLYADLVEKALKRDPANVQALTFKAEIAARQHNLQQALTAINQAITLQSAQPQNATRFGKDTGNTLLISKGNYLLEQKKFAEALTIFELAYPKAPDADQLYQRAKAEIGIGQYESAKKDLSEAAQRYLFWGRISRRDEVRKLLAEIGEKNLDNIDGAAVATLSESLEDERNRAKKFKEQIDTESRLKNAETLRRQQTSINEKCKNVLIAMSKSETKPLKLTDSLVDFATAATEMKQITAARALIDRAIRAYCSYGPLSEYDGGTVPLINNLNIFPYEQIGERLRTVAMRSEPFCDDGVGNFQQNRDAAFNNLIMQYEPEQQIVLLQTMIEVRKRQSKSPKISSKLWRDRLQYVETEVAKNPAAVSRPNSSGARRLSLSNRFIPGISEQFDTSLDAISTMEHLTHQLDSASERNTSSLADWRNFVHDLNCEPALKQMLRFSGALAIANTYLHKSEPKLAADCIHEAVSNLPDTNLDCLIDSLESLRSAAELNHDFLLAESAYDQVLDKLAPAQSVEPTSTLELKLSLAELLMNHQRALSDKEKTRQYQERADKLFVECESHRFDKDTVPELYSKTKMAVRRLIAMKYPALQKLDLPHGEIIYREIGPDKTIENYIEIGERGIIGRGPNEMTLGHTIEILIDGRTLAEKSFEQLDAGNLTEAEKIIIAALRAKPTAENFAMLGECWYLKNEKSNALQACLMALDMDSRNTLAIALKHIIRGAASTSKAETMILRAKLKKNNKDHAVTQALCLVALHDKAQARQILMQYFRKQPKSYLAKQLMHDLR
ncbi:MAG TPA: tetratricopeptide repeat protein [Drouetiella sp.]|jgi:tetratricopeptide (TPR) repeat protein